MSQIKQNQTERKYEEINGFEIRSGKFYDPNEHFNGPKHEIRILTKDFELGETLLSKIRSILQE